MAEKVRLIRLSWENDISFEMQTKCDGGSWITIVKMDENGCLQQLWEAGIASVCRKYFEGQINTIGAEMKA